MVEDHIAVGEMHLWSTEYMQELVPAFQTSELNQVHQRRVETPEILAQKLVNALEEAIIQILGPVLALLAVLRIHAALGAALADSGPLIQSIGSGE